jgi:signal transduction histidine kinase
LEKTNKLLESIKPRVEVIESRQVLTQKSNLLAILSVTRAIGSIFVLDELLSKIVDYALKVTGAERGFLFLCDDKANGLKLRLKRGLEREPPDLLFSYENYRISLELIKSVEKSKFPLIASLEGFPPPKIKVELENFGIKQAMAIPLMAKDKLSGLIYLDNCLAGRTFGEEDLEIMIFLGIQAGASIENAKLLETIEQSRNELKWLNRAKDKVLHRLSHELRTPLAVIQGNVRILRRKSQDQSSPVEIEKFFDAIEKHTNRLLDIQQEADAIIRFYPKLDEDWSHEQLNQHLRTTLTSPTPVLLFPFVQRLLEGVKQKAKDRQIFFLVEGRKDISVSADPRVFEEVLEGLLRNAIENTPDEGMVQVVLEETGQTGLLKVQDFGIGITEENQKYIFDGFFYTQETELYSSKKPYDFDAGGKGLDLLRMRVYSQRFGFDLSMESHRCIHLTTGLDLCPGRISKCPHCQRSEDCLSSGGSTFYVSFPIARKQR